MDIRQHAKINHYERILLDMVKMLREQQKEIDKLKRENSQMRQRFKCHPLKGASS